MMGDVDVPKIVYVPEIDFVMGGYGVLAVLNNVGREGRTTLTNFINHY